MTAHAATSVASFTRPTTVAEAVDLKASLGDDAVYLAGGTDLGVVLRRRQALPAHLICLDSIGEIQVLKEESDHLVVGAGVTHRRIEESPLFATALVALAEACRTVGSVQIRNVATIGGNLANASPAADVPPVMVALGAALDVYGPEGPRTIDIDQFFRGYRATALGPAEIIQRLRIPTPRSNTGSAFLKLGRRRAMEISIVCVGVRLVTDNDGTVTDAGIGLGSVAPTTVRAPASETVLLGRPLTDQLIAEAAEAAMEVCTPIDDVRASAAYRRSMVPVLVERGIRIAASRSRSSI